MRDKRRCEWWEETAARDSWPTRAAIRSGGSKSHQSADRKEKLSHIARTGDANRKIKV